VRDDALPPDVSDKEWNVRVEVAERLSVLFAASQRVGYTPLIRFVVDLWSWMLITHAGIAAAGVGTPYRAFSRVCLSVCLSAL